MKRLVCVFVMLAMLLSLVSASDVPAPIWPVTGKMTRVQHRSSDPDTSGWGAKQEGRIWFNTTTNEMKFWDGASVMVVGSMRYLQDADGDTGVYVEESADEDKIRLYTAGVERMVVDENGNIAIDTDALYYDKANKRWGFGTTEPGVKLHISDTGDTLIQIESSSTLNWAGLKLTANSFSWFIESRGAADSPNNRFLIACLLYTSPSPRDLSTSRMPSSA